jgi:hypothetical protein
MRRAPVESSSLASVGYQGAVLEVEFRNGGVYRYIDVPEEVHRRLMSAESKGRFFNFEIRDAYRCEQIAAAHPTR